MRVIDSGQSMTGDVLRADAIQFALLEELSYVDKYNARRIPTSFQLQQNYPNPFNPITNISYQIPVSAQVKIIVYNVLGEKIITLVDTQQLPGYYTVQWNGRDAQGDLMASGLYFYSIQTDQFIKTKKMMYLR